MYPHKMSRRKVSTTIYITPEQNEQLRLLHDKTKVPIAEYIRQGIDVILERHRLIIPGQQQSLFPEPAPRPASRPDPRLDAPSGARPASTPKSANDT